MKILSNVINHKIILLYIFFNSWKNNYLKTQTISLTHLYLMNCNLVTPAHLENLPLAYRG